MLPSLTGIMLSSVHENLRGSANSIATLCYNCFGWMPAPFIYGLVSKVMGDETSEEKSRIPLCFILYSCFFTLSMMTYVILKRLNSEKIALQLLKAEEIFAKEHDEEPLLAQEGIIIVNEDE